MSVALSFAETAFAFLARVHGDHDYDGHHGLEAICHLCGQGLAYVQLKEDNKVEDLVSNLRKSAKEAKHANEVARSDADRAAQEKLNAHLGVGARSALEDEE